MTLLVAAPFAGTREPSGRTVMSLNGRWEIEEGTRDAIPSRFLHSVPVPGLVVLADPPFVNAAPRVSDRRGLDQRDTLREAFWYRRRFNFKGPVPPFAILKVAKAMFGTKVFLNGTDLGDHQPCFTPGYFEADRALREGSNELVIRVGSCRSSLPRSVPTGFDFEKERYIPGIYDDIELILSGTPRVVRVQVVPRIARGEIGVQITLAHAGPAGRYHIELGVAEAKSAREVSRAVVDASLGGGEQTLDAAVPVPAGHLWSPEDPFLYELTVRTEGDECRTRFGMREFRFDESTHRALLNGRPYFMRGSNVTLYRFFEDDKCGGLPWRADWVRALHRSFKQFHWNCLRYCIGFPPEEWYRVADEEGFLIQDEFPIWYGGRGWCVWPKELHADEIAREYAEWMRERWNHPSVVIWDASNETVCNDGASDETGDAVRRVRDLDLSRRPWDNSYSVRREPGDVLESHPYHFQDSKFRLRDVAAAAIVPAGNEVPNEGKYPVIVNEYGWLWLNRDGTPTTLTRTLYENLLGRDSSVEQRRHLYATYLAAETEFWRAHRQCAAVMHFTALGYSRPDGQTSDHFTDVAALTYEGEFLKYMPDAFAPVGLMLDEWGNEIAADTLHPFRIIVTNDLPDPWSGAVRLQISGGSGIASEERAVVSLPPYGSGTLVIPCRTPRTAGIYAVIAVLEREGEKPVRSFREIPIR
ncbi:MAG TPA: glycoside hydrolase family 2 TIM barrel-domain containing protein [Bacteroidota bacterium]|nr:glycoside hydrolase family 2 TIM barrel-domain containing protein [Bacteroidota bacterium]